MLNEDYKDMLQCLLEEKVRFLRVGAYAVAVYGYPRATKDMDVFVRPETNKASNLLRALRRFGAPVSDISEVDFAVDGIVFQIGNSPRRIDIITRISGVGFEEADPNGKHDFAGQIVEHNDRLARGGVHHQASDADFDLGVGGFRLGFGFESRQVHTLV